MRSPCSLLATLLCVGPAFAAEQPPVSPRDSWSLRVHLLGNDDRVELRRSTPGLADLVCKTPCDALVRFQQSDLFTLDGRGLAGSAPFFFHPRDGEITLRVRAGSQVPRTIGTVLAAAGLSVMGVAGVYALPQLAFGDVFCDQDPACKEANARRRTATLAVFLAGLGVGLAGAVILFTHPATRFTVEQ